MPFLPLARLDCGADCGEWVAVRSLRPRTNHLRPFAAMIIKYLTIFCFLPLNSPRNFLAIRPSLLQTVECRLACGNSTMRSLRALASTSLLLRHGLVGSRHTPVRRRLLEIPSLAGGVSQARFVFRGALATTTTDAENKSNLKQRYSRPTNDEIEADIIQMVKEDGGLDVPTRKSNVLYAMRRSEQILVQLDAGDIAAGRPAVCKIMPLDQFRDQERTKEKAARMAKHTAKTSTKQIELNWSINPHDLSHRLKKISSFVDKGRTVEIVLTKKRAKRVATAEEIKQLMDRMRAAIEEANAHQTKPMEGEIGKTLTITIEKKS